MNRDEINRIILDNGLFHGTMALGVVMDADHLERFANLVAAAEREACAQVAEEMGNIDGNMNKTWRNGCFDTALAIRERGAP
jgi:hypothetical protein